jgi:hypothetical protein
VHGHCGVVSLVTDNTGIRSRFGCELQDNMSRRFADHSELKWDDADPTYSAEPAYRRTQRQNVQPARRIGDELVTAY